MKKIALFAYALAMAFSAQGVAAKKLEGMVKIDGSSTVFPITEAVAEEFKKEEPQVRVTVGVSGTGGGFKKFVASETDINDASRPIKETEAAMAKQNGVDYLELPVAYDGITVIVNPKNDWATSMTVAELKKIWAPDSKVKTWKDIRPSWPDREIKLYGPGTDSGTFDYFTEEINGKSQVSRQDFTMSEDDNVLVTGVVGNRDSLGYLGFSYYQENMKSLKAVAIDNGKGAVAPTIKTINDGSYAPLSRPIFIYVSKKSAKKAEVSSFVNFYLAKAPALVSEVGYVPLPKEKYAEAVNNFKTFSK